MKKFFLTVVVMSAIFNGCSSGIRFFISPYEMASKMKSENDIGQRREILWDLDYRAVVVQETKKNDILPVQHYRPEHTFGNRIHPLDVSYEQPMTLGTLVILKNIQKPIGIAIKKKADNDWRIYWLQDADIKDIRNEGVVYLPQYEDLPLLQE